MTTKRVKPPTEAEVRALVEKEWAAWCETEGTESAIVTRIRSRLDRNVEATVAQLLGFRNRGWAGRDEWEVDNCNGRAGNSIVGDYIRKKVGVAVEAWVDSFAGALPTLPRETIAALRKEYVDAYRNALRRRLGELASERAEEKAREMIAALDEEATPSESEAEGGT